MKTERKKRRYISPSVESINLNSDCVFMLGSENKGAKQQKSEWTDVDKDADGDIEL